MRIYAYQKKRGKQGCEEKKWRPRELPVAKRSLQRTYSNDQVRRIRRSSPLGGKPGVMGYEVGPVQDGIGGWERCCGLGDGIRLLLDVGIEYPAQAVQIHAQTGGSPMPGKAAQVTISEQQQQILEESRRSRSEFGWCPQRPHRLCNSWKNSRTPASTSFWSILLSAILMPGVARNARSDIERKTE
jgi:hypothetical protein